MTSSFSARPKTAAAVDQTRIRHPSMTRPVRCGPAEHQRFDPALKAVDRQLGGKTTNAHILGAHDRNGGISRIPRRSGIESISSGPNWLSA